MKNRSGVFLSIFLKSTFVVCFFIVSCTSSPTGKKDSSEQLNFTANVSELLNDTVSVNPLVDSLKRQIKTTGKENQLLCLGELAENWRANTFLLASEELKQARAIGSARAEGDALCKLGIFYCRKFDFDSCNYFLGSAADLAVKNKLDDVLAQSLSWQAEAARQSGKTENFDNLQDKAIILAKQVNDKKRLAFCYISKGEAARFKSDYAPALECYSKALAYATEINDLNKITICYNSTGDVYRIQSDLPRALEYFNKGLSIARKNKNKNQISFCLSCMGDIYNAQKEYTRALTFYEEAYAIATDLGLKVQQCNSLSSLGMSYFLLEEKEKALEYFDKTIKLAEEIGFKDKIAFASMVEGDIYTAQGKAERALSNYKRAIEIDEATGNKSLLERDYEHLSKFYFGSKKLAEARSAAIKSLELSKETETPEGVKNAARILSDVLEKQNDFKESLKMLRLFNKMRDSISSEENVRKFSAIEYAAKEEGLKAEQKAKEDVFKAEQARKEEELKRQKTIRYAFTIGFILVLALALVVYRGLRLNKKQNKIITAQKKEMEHQKEIVEEKNKEIIDSITYAKRLQDAILPPVKMMKQWFPESFIYYQPKDIIAGDFYWMEHIGDTTFFAAADSTGHGVPGAMVSVVCSNALNRAIKEFKLNAPGTILDKTRELVLETFEKSEGDVKDGMDISLLSVDHKNKTINWAGANNPLWFVTPSNNEVTEIKANKQPIGKTDNPQPFTTHSIEYVKGTIFYLLTDGFADQFGGPKGKKFKYKQLEDFLLLNCGKDMEEQSRLLEETFQIWRGHFDQVDDVTLIGVKL